MLPPSSQTIPQSSAVRTDSGLLVQMRPFPGESSPAVEAAWRDLERRSLLRNPFLSPSFLLSQTPIDSSKFPAKLLTIIDGEGRWLLAGVFDEVTADRHLPLPHLRAMQSEHSFKTGLLVDATHCESVVQTLWAFLKKAGWHGVTFPSFPLQSSLARLLGEHCERQQFAVRTDDIHWRATVTPFDEVTMSSRRAKSLRRGRRALGKHGKVSLQFSACTPEDQSAIDRFLYLESLGWKGDTQSALACSLPEVVAMRNMAIGFAQHDRIRFAELSIDQRVIASLCLLRSETDYYAFKIGWDPQFERGCPGFLLAAEVQEHLQELPQCERLDGCARPGSFLDHVWPGRKQIGTAIFPTTRWGSLAAGGTEWARHLYRRWKGTFDKSSDMSPEATAGSESPPDTSDIKESTS